MTEKISLKLKEPLLDMNLDPMHDMAALKAEQIEKIKLEHPTLNPNEMLSAYYEQSPLLTFGDALKNVLNKLKFEKNEDAADVFVWIRSIKQELRTGKGELQVDKDDIKELIELIDKLPKELIDAITIGQVYSILKDAEKNAS